MRKSVCISKSHEKIKYLKDVQKGKFSYLVATEDLYILNVAIHHQIEIECIYFITERKYRVEANECLQKLSYKAKEIYEISEKTYETICEKENAVGIIAILHLNKSSWEDMKKDNFILVADRLEIPGNLGTLIRTMDATGCKSLILVDSIVNPFSEKALKSSRGMMLTIQEMITTYEECQRFLLENGYTIFLGEPELGKSYEECDYTGKIAIVIGSERYGIHPEWYQNPHKKVFIPMIGEMTSLNVGVAGSILLYEAFLKRKK